MAEFTALRDESIQRVCDSAWYRSTPDANSLLATARLCPDPASFGAQLDALSSAAGVEFADLTSS